MSRKCDAFIYAKAGPGGRQFCLYTLVFSAETAHVGIEDGSGKFAIKNSTGAAITVTAAFVSSTVAVDGTVTLDKATQL